jgi:hypothetical protein
MGIFTGDDDVYIAPNPSGTVMNRNPFGSAAWNGNNGVSDGQNGVVIGTNGAAQDVRRYQGMGEAASSNPAPQANYGQADQYLRQGQQRLGLVGADRLQAMQARDQQMQAMGLTAAAAQGRGQSQATMLGQQQAMQAHQAAQAAAASSRGGAMGQAAALRRVGQGAAGQMAQSNQQLDAIRMQERMAAQNQYMQAANGMRQQDAQGQTQDSAQAKAYGQLGKQHAANAAYNSTLGMQQRALNDQSQQAYEGMAYNVNNAQLGANIQQRGLLMGANQAAANRDYAAKQAVWNTAIAGVSGGSSALGQYASHKAQGGPVSAGRPYIVGERGPELVIPSMGEVAARRFQR